ncbi:MAG: magnesium transporter, partial [Opitutales bacterium]
ELLEWPREALEQLSARRLAETSDYTLGQFLERLDVEQSRDVLRQLSVQRVSGILSETDEEWAAEILVKIRESRAQRILDAFEPDDAADIIAELEEEDRKRLMEILSAKDRARIEALLAYEPDTAGGIMTTAVDLAFDNMTIDEAIARIREFAGEHDDLHYVYVVDKKQHLRGTVSLRKLIQAKPQQRIADVMQTELRGVVPPEMDQETVALLMAEHNLPDIAVVDAQHRLLGIITHDDILDVVQEEATEDLLIMSGAGGDETVHDDVLYSVRRRQPWLVVNLITAFFAAFVVSLFESEIRHLPIMAALMPIIAGVGGNSGQQALAVAIRSLALGQLHPGEGRKVILKQTAIGLINGLLVGLVAGGAVYFLADADEQPLLLSGVVLAAMILNMVVAGLAGAFVPLFLRAINRDPAQSSSILLTAVTDAGGFFIFLGLGSWLLL